LTSASKMRQCYVAADVFVSPTLADNLPVSLIEATASGTPGVAFGVGGVSDIVRHMETGYLAKERDSMDLASGIKWILSDRSRRVALSRKCRVLAENEYALDLQVARYADLYGELLAMNRLNPDAAMINQNICHPEPQRQAPGKSLRGRN
jgi:glycosyltransferase involved in cell wall biosynthesis